MEKFSELTYQRPDIGQIILHIEKYKAAFAAAKSEQELRDLFFAYKAVLVDFQTLQVIARIRNSFDTRDAFYAEEIAFFHRETPKLALLTREVDETLLASPYLGQLKQELGELYFKNLALQTRFADKSTVDDQIEESRLCQVYAKLTANAAITFKGEPCSFYRLLKHMQSTDRDTRRDAFTAWAALYQQIAPELDRLYDELVRIRCDMADKLGFDSYVDMVYLRRRHFDYTPKDVAAFRQQVKEVITPACAELRRRQAERLGVEKLKYYDESLLYPDDNPIPIGTTQELVEKAQRMYREMSPETGAYFDCMVEHEMFDLETRPGKNTGGYCTGLMKYKLPLIFSNFNGTSADVDVLTHEAGHGFEYYMASRNLPLTDLVLSTSDVNEIHSMSMEHFAYPWMELFFGEKADQYRYAHLMDALEVIPYMVCVDEFQHEVFARPEMTAAERRATWRRIEQYYMPWRDYDGNEFLEEGGFWMQKLHIFLHPFYYIDYAMAQMGAFEFYTQSKTDRAGAWQRYVELCKSGGRMGYNQLLAHVGLSNPLHPGAVAKAVKGVLEELGV